MHATRCRLPPWQSAIEWPAAAGMVPWPRGSGSVQVNFFHRRSTAELAVIHRPAHAADFSSRWIAPRVARLPHLVAHYPSRRFLFSYPISRVDCSWVRHLGPSSELSAPLFAAAAALSLFSRLDMRIYTRLDVGWYLISNGFSFLRRFESIAAAQTVRQTDETDVPASELSW